MIQLKPGFTRSTQWWEFVDWSRLARKKERVFAKKLSFQVFYLYITSSNMNINTFFLLPKVEVEYSLCKHGEKSLIPRVRSVQIELDYVILLVPSRCLSSMFVWIRSYRVITPDNLFCVIHIWFSSLGNPQLICIFILKKLNLS